jgi:hypothetical protein
LAVIDHAMQCTACTRDAARAAGTFVSGILAPQRVSNWRIVTKL